ncbi:hypothetical protein CEXT_4381 [Caerostris extrusa]|uniref:Uncharacterized protein n=1 Tax=Caerostris extrusa TaxID=172846 RepID=A0AAV4QZX2_CAEEX|nr:hypothetical protein CEXT_4381 [Caerostris extrusa]
MSDVRTQIKVLQISKQITVLNGKLRYLRSSHPLPTSYSTLYLNSCLATTFERFTPTINLFFYIYIQIPVWLPNSSSILHSNFILVTTFGRFIPTTNLLFSWLRGLVGSHTLPTTSSILPSNSCLVSKLFFYITFKLHSGCDLWEIHTYYQPPLLLVTRFGRFTYTTNHFFYIAFKLLSDFQTLLLYYIQTSFWLRPLGDSYLLPTSSSSGYKVW